MKKNFLELVEELMYKATNNDLKSVAQYIGDTPETVLKHYINVKVKIVDGDDVVNVIPAPPAIF